MRRMLSTVLAADVAGYSRLMQANSDSTLAALMRLRADVLRPVVAARHGRIVKSMGDGWLAVFSTAVEAVECAMQVQDRLAADPVVRLRMGLHLGDVTEAEEDVFGDAVNVASRLQALAEPGAVAVSEPVYVSLDGTLRPSFEDAGLRRLRHIARPLRVFVRGGAVAGGSEERTSSDFPRVAIRPVSTADPRPALRDLAEALTGDLMTCLGGTQWVRARITAEPEPGAYVLTGALRARGDRVRLDMALDAPDGFRVWSDRHDGSLGDSFEWQDRTTSAVATLAFRRMLGHAARGIEATPRAERTAQQWALLALIRGGADGESHRRALVCLEEAIRLAPDWGYVHALALAVLMGGVSLGLARFLEPWLGRQAAWMDRVEALEPPVAAGRIMLAFARLVRTRDPDSVQANVRAQLQGLPFEPDVLIWAGYIHLYTGDPEAALACFERFGKGVVLDAYLASVRAGAAGAMLQLGRFAEAAALAEEAARINPLYPSPLRIAAAAHASLGRADRARAALAALDRLSPNETIGAFRANSGYCDTPATRRYFEALKLAGMPD